MVKLKDSFQPLNTQLEDQFSVNGADNSPVRIVEDSSDYSVLHCIF